MSSGVLPVIETIPVPTGSAEYEAARTSILQDFAASVPKELVLPESLITRPPKNVTAIPRHCGLLSSLEITITEDYDAYSLAAAVASRKFTAVQVATAFAKRAIIAHQLSSCLTEWFPGEAMERAKALDAYLLTNGRTVGPLHGVPISLKAHIPLSGHWSNVGYRCTIKQDDEDCLMVRILRNAGAVFYCKTNQPQSIMHLESTSLYGRVLNPHNIKLSAGGSTGGEAALIALRGSPLGVGTDIGGSIRGPAGFCGIYGFKPTSYMLPMKDFLDGGFGAELNILCSTGPMCTSLRDVDLFMSTITSAKPYLEDPRVIPIPWSAMTRTRDANTSPLKVGFMMHDGVIMPQPPVTRTLQWARSQLEKLSGFHVKDFEPYETAKAMKNIRLAYWPDGGKVSRDRLTTGGDPVLPLTEWILKDATEQGELTPASILQSRRDRDAFRCAFSKHWESQGVDLVICPVFVGPACSHETAWHWNYTGLWNYVDYPGIVVPTPFKALPKGEEDYTSKAPLSEACMQVRQLWAEGDFEGAPINLQIVTRRYHDNDLVSYVHVIKEALQL